MASRGEAQHVSVPVSLSRALTIIQNFHNSACKPYLSQGYCVYTIPVLSVFFLVNKLNNQKPFPKVWLRFLEFSSNGQPTCHHALIILLQFVELFPLKKKLLLDPGPCVRYNALFLGS